MTSALFFSFLFGAFLKKGKEGRKMGRVTVLLLVYALALGKAVIVHFDSVGGISSYSQKIVEVGKEYGELPTANKTGYTLDGWYKEKTGNDKIEPTTIVTKTSTHHVYAHWNAETYTVILNATGGQVSPKMINVTYGETYGNLPTPTREANNFLWWRTVNGTQVLNTTVVKTASVHTLYASWENTTVTFDFGNETNYSIFLKYNETISYPDDPIRPGYTFKGWDRHPTTTNGEDMIITAVWEKNKEKGNKQAVAIGICVAILFIVVITTLAVLLFRATKRSGEIKGVEESDYNNDPDYYEEDEERSSRERGGREIGRGLLGSEVQYDRYERKRGDLDNDDRSYRREK